MITLNRSFIAASLLVLTATVVEAAPYKELGTLSHHDRFLKDNDCCVVVYYADWCTACKNMQPAFEEVARNNGHRAGFAKANLDQDPSLKPLVKKLGIQAYPTTVIYKNGKEVRKERGSLGQQEIERMVEQSAPTREARRPQGRQPRPQVVARQAQALKPQPQPRRTRLAQAQTKPAQVKTIKVAQRQAVAKTSALRRS